MNRITISFLFCAVLASVTASGQKRCFKGADWESELPVVRQRYNHSLQGQKGLIRKNTFKFFPTGSGHTGELFQAYRLIQLGDKSDVEAFQKIEIRYPSEAFLTHLDYRVWKDGLIIYEAKPKSIHTQISDSVQDIRNGRNKGFTLSLSDLEPEVVVEIFYKAQGVHLPYWLEFQDSLRWQHSEQQIRIISSDPLQYVKHPQVAATEERNYDELVYTFSAENTAALPPKSGAFYADTSRPFVALEWKDLIQRYDRDRIKTWTDFLPYLFFDGAVKNLNIYLNSEARYLGQNIHSGTSYLPPKRYHTRDEELHENFRQAWGRYRLGKDYAAPLVALQEWVKALADSTLLSDQLGLRLIEEALKAYVNSGLQDLKQPPYAFYDHGTISKFYTDFLRLRGRKYYPVLLKAPTQGPFLDSLISARQVGALAVAYELDGARNIILVGPYLGNYYSLNTLPADFSAGTAVFFDPATQSYAVEKLPAFNTQNNGFQYWEDIQLSFKFNWLRSTKRYYLEGNFQNRIYHAYLQNDTARDVLSATNWQVANNAVNNRERLNFKTEQLRQPRDTMVYHLSLEKALAITAEPSAKCFVFPSPYRATMNFRLFADRAFAIDTEHSVLYNEPGAYALRINTTRINEKEYLIELSFTLEEILMKGEEAEKFSQIVGLLQKGITIKIFPKK